MAGNSLSLRPRSSPHGFTLGFLQSQFSGSNRGQKLGINGGVTLFQPSEFMKISYILILARVIVQFTQKHKEKERTIALDFHLILWLIVFTLPVLVLLALQSDLGTALVFVAIFAGLVLLSGVSWKIIIPFLRQLYQELQDFWQFSSQKMGVLSCIRSGCQPIRSTVSLLGSIPLIMHKRPPINRPKGKSPSVVEAYLVKDLMYPISLFPFVRVI